MLGCRWSIGPEVLRHRRSRSTTLVQGQLSRRVHLQIVDSRVSRRIRLLLRHLQARGDLQDCPTGHRLESQKLCLIEVSRGVLLLRSVRRPSTKSPRSWRKEQDQPHRRDLRLRTRLRGVATGRRRGCGFQILIREIWPDLSIGGPLNLHLKLCLVLLRRLSVLIARRKRGRSKSRVTGRGEASDFVEVRVEQVEEEQIVPPTEPAETEAAPTPETPEESTPESRRQARRILREGAKHLKEQAKELRGTRSRPSSTTSPPESSLSPQTEARTQAFAKSKGRKESGEAAPADRKKQKLEALPRPPLPPVRHRTPPVEPRAASVPRPAEAPLAIEDQAAERPQLTQPVRPVRLQPRPKGSPQDHPSSKSLART